MGRARRRHPFLGAACLALYAIVVLASPSLHHDIECHLKSPGHCQACVANPLAPRTSAIGEAGTIALVEAGRPDAPPSARVASVVAPLLSGRAPPR